MSPWEKKHSEMAAGLAKPGEAILASLTPGDMAMIHAIIGVCGEAAELMEALYEPDMEKIDRENVVEELGDIEFYLVELRRHLGVSRPAFPGNSESICPRGETHTKSCMNLLIEAGRLMDLIKKASIYRKHINTDEIMVLLGWVDNSLNEIREFFGVSREHTLIHNYNKLERRYPGFKYSDQAAQERADKA